MTEAPEIRSPLHQLSGVDLTQIDAIGPYTALRLIAEIGTDMTRWPSEKLFTSWLTLAPKNKITGGRLISSRTMPSANRAAAMLRMCAMSAGKTSTALGAFSRQDLRPTSRSASASAAPEIWLEAPRSPDPPQLPDRIQPYSAPRWRPPAGALYGGGIASPRSVPVQVV